MRGICKGKNLLSMCNLNSETAEQDKTSISKQKTAEQPEFAVWRLQKNASTPNVKKNRLIETMEVLEAENLEGGGLGLALAVISPTVVTSTLIRLVWLAGMRRDIVAPSWMSNSLLTSD